MKKNLIALGMSLAMTMPAFAGSNGTQLTDSTFDDYLVRVFSGNESCGGQLIAGKYVVTAAHCVADAWGSRLSDKWMAIPSDGALTETQVADADLSVYFGNATYTSGTKLGVSAATLFHDYVYLYQNSNTVSDFDTEMKSEWESNYGLTDGEVFSPFIVFGDIAVFQLSESAQQQTAAMLMTTSKNVEDGVDVRWAGWGITTEGGRTPETANYGYMTYTAFPWDSWWTELDFFVDHEHATPKDGSMSCDGDSGTPVTIDGKVLGYVRSHSGDCGDTGSELTFTNAWFYIDWLAQQIDAVNTVSEKVLAADAAGAHTVTWTIPVQSLKVDDVTFNPQIVDSTGLFTSDDLSNCEGTFATGESCEITVTFNAGGNTVSSNASATLVLNDELSIPLSYTIRSTSGGDDGSTDDGSGDNGGSTGGDSSSSGGGSANWLVLVGLAGLALRRKSRR